MNENLVIVAVILAGIGGLAVLALTLLVRRKTGSVSSDQSLGSPLSARDTEFEACYDGCMAAGLWEPRKSDACVSICRSQVDLRL